MFAPEIDTAIILILICVILLLSIIIGSMVIKCETPREHNPKFNVVQVGVIGEIQTAEILKDMEIDFIRNYRISSNSPIFDFYLPAYNCAIEYDEEHHYNISCAYYMDKTMALEEYRRVRNMDHEKNRFIVSSNQYHLVRVNYTMSRYMIRSTILDHLMDQPESVYVSKLYEQD